MTVLSRIAQWLGIGSTKSVRVAAKFDAAQTTPENQRHWLNADSLSPDASANAVTRHTIRNRSRYEIANNPLLLGMVNTKASTIIGSSGPRLRMMTGDTEIDKRIDQAWALWARETGLAQAMLSMAKAKISDGEEFGLIRLDESIRHPVQMRIQPFECDRCTFGNKGTLGQVDGIEYDAVGNPAAYYIMPEHPGGTFSLTADPVRVGAALVLHGFTPTRPEQSRGISELAPALGWVAILRRYISAMTLSAELGASMPIIIESQLPPDADEATGLNAFDTFEFERNMATTLPHGFTAKGFDNKNPNPNADPFIRRMVSLIARCMEMPYNVAAADSSSHNFASGRLDNYGFYHAVAVERRAREFYLDRNVFPIWLTLLRGSDPSLDGLDISKARHEWRWDSVETTGDPVAEASAIEIKLRTKQTTHAQVYADQGLDWEDAREQLAVEAEAMREIAPDPFTGDQARSAVEVLRALSAHEINADAARSLCVKLGMSADEADAAVRNVPTPKPEPAAQGGSNEKAAA